MYSRQHVNPVNLVNPVNPPLSDRVTDLGPISPTCVLPLMDNSALMYYVFHIDRSHIKFAAISANPQRLRRTLFGCQVTMPKSSAHAPGSFANRLADCVGKACGLPGESGITLRAVEELPALVASRLAGPVAGLTAPRAGGGARLRTLAPVALQPDEVARWVGADHERRGVAAADACALLRERGADGADEGIAAGADVDEVVVRVGGTPAV